MLAMLGCSCCSCSRVNTALVAPLGVDAVMVILLGATDSWYPSLPRLSFLSASRKTMDAFLLLRAMALLSLIFSASRLAASLSCDGACSFTLGVMVKAPGLSVHDSGFGIRSDASGVLVP